MKVKKNITIDDQKSIVMSYINKHQMNVDIFFSSADFSSIIAQINSENHTIIVANIACLGNKLENLMSSKLDLISITNELKDGNYKTYLKKVYEEYHELY